MRKRLVVGIPVGLLGVALAAYLVLPWPVSLRWRDAALTSFMRYRQGEASARGETLEIRQEWVPLAAVSRHLQRAVIVAEDGHFYEHSGIDWRALGEEVRYRGDDAFSWLDPRDLRSLSNAVRYYWGHRNRVRGRSTITQQLAKNLYFTPERSLARKLQELLVAQRLEWFLSKDRILELYLNTAEWGPGVFGAEAAARRYYGSSARELAPDQAAALAATLPHPLTSNPGFRPSRMAWRQQLILQRMFGGGPVATVPLEPPGELEAPQVVMPVIDLGDPGLRFAIPAAPDTAAGAPADSLETRPTDSIPPRPPPADADD